MFARTMLSGWLVRGEGRAADRRAGPGVAPEFLRVRDAICHGCPATAWASGEGG
jgi:hypothetical protein